MRKVGYAKNVYAKLAMRTYVYAKKWLCELERLCYAQCTRVGGWSWLCEDPPGRWYALAERKTLFGKDFFR
jgi:hypothetical protein